MSEGQVYVAVQVTLLACPSRKITDVGLIVKDEKEPEKKCKAFKNLDQQMFL